MSRIYNSINLVYATNVCSRYACRIPTCVLCVCRGQMKRYTWIFMVCAYNRSRPYCWHFSSKREISKKKNEKLSSLFPPDPRECWSLASNRNLIWHNSIGSSVFGIINNFNICIYICYWSSLPSPPSIEWKHHRSANAWQQPTLNRMQFDFVWSFGRISSAAISVCVAMIIKFHFSRIFFFFVCLSSYYGRVCILYRIYRSIGLSILLKHAPPSINSQILFLFFSIDFTDLGTFSNCINWIY